MPRVSFTTNLQRHVECPSLMLAACQNGQTVFDVLEKVFAEHPRLRGYVVDEQGALRKHMVIFVDGTAIRDRSKLSDAVGDTSEVYIFQALSGG